MTTVAPPPNAAVDAALAGVAPGHLSGVTALRCLIFEVADEIGATPLGESVKWGQPSYVSVRPRESTAVRIGSTGDGNHFGLFFHCRSSVVSEFRNQFPHEFRYDGNRGILFAPGDDLQIDRLRLCVEHALRYRVAATARPRHR